MTATCPKCGETKAADEFYRDKSKPAGRASHCKACQRERSRQQWRDRREALREYNRVYHRDNRGRARERFLLATYGITVEQFDALLASQGGACAVCRNPGEPRLHVDHDHATGVVRGVLCSGCNRGLGFFGDDPARLRAAAEYLVAVPSS